MNFYLILKEKGIIGTEVKTSHGFFMLEASEKGLFRLNVIARRPQGRRSNPRTEIASLPLVARNDEHFATQKKHLQKASAALIQYLDGKTTSFPSLQYDLSGFTHLETIVLKALAEIKQGQVTSYAALAKKSGVPRASRFVGSVMRKNRLPILFPCHRVVRSNGVLGRYSLGDHWKKTLLQLEGVSVIARNRVVVNSSLRAPKGRGNLHSWIASSPACRTGRQKTLLAMTGSRYNTK